MSAATLKLKGFSYPELFTAQGLDRLDAAFLAFIDEIDQTFHAQILEYRIDENSFSPMQLSDLVIKGGILLETFLVQLFDIQGASDLLKAKTLSSNPIAIFKQTFVLRKAKKRLLKTLDFPSFAELNTWLTTALTECPLQTDDKELAVALLGDHYLRDENKFSNSIEKLTQWCIQAISTADGKKYVAGWTSFRIPERLDYNQLISMVFAKDHSQQLAIPAENFRKRDGFKLTDERMSAREVQDEANYCIYCHDHDGDFCSKGFPVKKNDLSLGLKKNPLDVVLTGCPLEEKISEMNMLRRDGFNLAALATIMIDNPMCPATGHRICNDCMKACIYQKQEPVNIPQIETRVLTDVLDLPWGVEIYDLLTRWNPLRPTQWRMKAYNGKKVMIAGMGPAGFTLAHHLLLEGFAVVGFDGLKIESLPQTYLTQPIQNFSDLKENLDERLMAGFGGVAEYGITVRWDKNFLKLIYISLMRKPLFQVFGGVRFGGTITVEDAWDLGFHHFAIAVGAGLPKALNVPGSLAPGMRQANDFLMALQLGNAAKFSSLTNLQIRLPAVVIGGGLTGVDTATEAQAYYITQVEKTLFRYEKLCEVFGDDYVVKKLDTTSKIILDEFLAHGKAARDERLVAQQHKRKPNFLKLIHQWGGVTIVYRRRMQDSPAYINNHEELKKALEEGIFYAETLDPKEALLDEFGHVKTLVCHKRSKNELDIWETTAEEIDFPARSILVATGTQPNVAYEFEHRGTFNKHRYQYFHYEDENKELKQVEEVIHCKQEQFGPFTSYNQNDKRVSLIGDTHPVFHGNVVKAIASALRSYPKILKTFDALDESGDVAEYEKFAIQMQLLFDAQITDMQRKTNALLELTIDAPIAAKNYRPGHFYRMQNFETTAAEYEKTSFQMEPLALTCSGVDGSKLKFLVMETGASSKLVATFKVGDKVSLMGPTGVRQRVPEQNETVLIVGNQLSLPLLLTYGAELKALGSKVIYLGNFKNASEVFCLPEMQAACDVMLINSPTEIKLERPQDLWVNDDVIGLLKQHHEILNLHAVEKIIVIDGCHLLKRLQTEIHGSLKEVLVKNPKISASVYSTMQCMLKGVCAQCLQWQIDPETGKRTKAVFACSWPEQPIEMIDFDNINERQVQNKLQEHISNLWLDYVLEKNSVTRV